MTKRIFATAIAAAVIATSLPTAGAANALTVVPTSAKGQAVYVGSIRVYPTGYNINDNNYSNCAMLASWQALAWTGTRTRALSRSALRALHRS